LWWRTDPDQTLYVYYDDGTSQQWVVATPMQPFVGTAAGGDLQGSYPNPTLKAAIVTAAKLAADAKSVNARVARSVNQSIPGGGAWTTLTWDTVSQDTGGFYSSGQPTRLTVPSTGMYFFGCGQEMQFGTASGRTILSLAVNGSEVTGAADYPRGLASDWARANVTHAMRLNAGDWVSVFMYSTSSGAQTADTSGIFWIVRVP
jgi:hypothetical protein